MKASLEIDAPLSTRRAHSLRTVCSETFMLVVPVSSCALLFDLESEPKRGASAIAS